MSDNITNHNVNYDYQITNNLNSNIIHNNNINSNNHNTFNNVNDMTTIHNTRNNQQSLNPSFQDNSFTDYNQHFQAHPPQHGTPYPSIQNPRIKTETNKKDFDNQMANHNQAYLQILYGHDKWPYNVEKIFTVALRLIIKSGTSKIKIRNKNYGRNELISLYIRFHTGELRTKKQISSHIQVWKKSIMNKISTNMHVTPLEKEILELIENGAPQDENSIRLFYSTFEEIISTLSKDDSALEFSTTNQSMYNGNNSNTTSNYTSNNNNSNYYSNNKGPHEIFSKLANLNNKPATAEPQHGQLQREQQGPYQVEGQRQFSSQIQQSNGNYRNVIYPQDVNNVNPNNVNQQQGYIYPLSSQPLFLSNNQMPQQPQIIQQYAYYSGTPAILSTNQVPQQIPQQLPHQQQALQQLAQPQQVAGPPFHLPQIDQNSHHIQVQQTNVIPPPPPILQQQPQLPQGLSYHTLGQLDAKRDISRIFDTTSNNLNVSSPQLNNNIQLTTSTNVMKNTDSKNNSNPINISRNHNSINDSTNNNVTRNANNSNQNSGKVNNVSITDNKSNHDGNSVGAKDCNSNNNNITSNNTGNSTFSNNSSFPDRQWQVPTIIQGLTSSSSSSSSSSQLMPPNWNPNPLIIMKDSTNATRGNIVYSNDIVRTVPSFTSSITLESSNSSITPLKHHTLHATNGDSNENKTNDITSNSSTIIASTTAHITNDVIDSRNVYYTSNTVTDAKSLDSADNNNKLAHKQDSNIGKLKLPPVDKNRFFRNSSSLNNNTKTDNIVNTKVPTVLPPLNLSENSACSIPQIKHFNKETINSSKSFALPKLIQGNNILNTTDSDQTMINNYWDSNTEKMLAENRTDSNNKK